VVALILVSANTTGVTSGYAMLAIGLLNSIMFPTIFTLACEGLDSRAADGSGIINVAIVGGAVIPPLTGFAADRLGSLQLSLAIPALCYLVIAGYGLYAARKRV
jgi:MFS transporter, FHS family, L-fucose permease